MCAQRKANKCIPTEDDIIQSNINSFGDDIGKITNRATSMYNVLAQYEPGTKEYDTLNYRIMASQLYQQNAMESSFQWPCAVMRMTNTVNLQVQGVA